MQRRQAQSAGKTGLPPAQERVRDGLRSASTPSVAAVRPAVTAAPPPPPVVEAQRAPVSAVESALSGRSLSMQRRRLQAAGKSALPPRGAPPAAYAPAQPDAQPIAAGHTPALPEPCTSGSCREQARARRATLSQQGRGSAPAAPPSRPARVGTIEYAPKVVESGTHGGQRVTGLRTSRGAEVTGDERGTAQPVSGTQYIAAESGAAWRAGGPKVGQARTEGGLVVSGTLVRSKVRVTGDEAGARVTITGEADQRLDDDLTPRAEGGAAVSSQFQRQANPHGATVFGTNLGRSARGVGSRERDRTAPLEATEHGQKITGSALGRSLRVTGDEGGACRTVTGSQYLAPARRQAACGHQGGGTAPAEQLGTARPDPVTGAKVSESVSWGGQRVTGVDVEHNPLVTGDEPGACAILTGSQYQGRGTQDGFCDPVTAAAAAARHQVRQAERAITGDTPVHDQVVTGTGRGAARDITGTPYYRDAGAAPAAPADPVAALDGQFSVRSPQRAAQLRAERRAAPEAAEGGRITGSFAVGGGKITGNTEFQPRLRAGGNPPPDKKPAHARLSGEGSTTGRRITGDSWADQTNVTGTEGSFAADRNPTEQGGKRQVFAGAATFKAQAKHEEPRQLVTGMFGYFSKTGARVTLSGGAQS